MFGIGICGMMCYASAQLVSCSGDGMIYHTDIITAQETSSSCFDCHDGAVYEVYVNASDHSTVTNRLLKVRSKSSVKLRAILKGVTVFLFSAF